MDKLEALNAQIERDLSPEAVKAFEEYWKDKDIPGNQFSSFAKFVASWAFVAGWNAHRDSQS